MFPLSCISSLPSTLFFLIVTKWSLFVNVINTEARKNWQVWKRGRRLNMTKGICILLGLCLNRVSWRRERWRQIPLSQPRSASHLSGTSWNLYQGKSFFCTEHLSHFSWKGRKKSEINAATMIAGQSSWMGPSSGCQVRICAELEIMSRPWSTPSCSHWCLRSLAAPAHCQHSVVFLQPQDWLFDAFCCWSWGHVCVICLAPKTFTTQIKGVFKPNKSWTEIPRDKMVRNICWNHDQMNWLEVKISVVLKSVSAIGITTVSEQERLCGRQLIKVIRNRMRNILNQRNLFAFVINNIQDLISHGLSSFTV